MQVLYSGDVQGIGFRYTAKSVATGFDVTGTVRNLPSGGVELIAEGRRERIGSLSPGDSRIGPGSFYSGRRYYLGGTQGRRSRV